MNESSIDTYKILILGDSLTGKSSILHRYTEFMFSLSTTRPTIGPLYKIRKIRINNHNEVKLEIWDSSSFIPSFYYRDVSGFILVFDITNLNSMNNIKEYWLKEIEKHSNNINNNNNNNNNNINNTQNKTNNPSPIPIIILANKIDLLNNDSSSESSIVSIDQIKEFSNSINIPTFQVSAKDNSGIEESFNKLATIIFNQSHHDISNNNNNQNLFYNLYKSCEIL